MTSELTESARRTAVVPNNHSSVAGTTDSTLLNVVAMFVEDRKTGREQAEARDIADRTRAEARDLADQEYRAQQLRIQKALRLPALPKLATSKEWPDFFQIAEAYLANATYSPGGDGSLIETEDN